jgi:hypothetical protein
MEAKLRIVPDSYRDHLFLVIYYESWENLIKLKKWSNPFLRRFSAIKLTRPYFSFWRIRMQENWDLRKGSGFGRDTYL